uniref:Cyclin C-terminal domain-containing protein n=1 Tax=Salix viminalis TaxID=40686 RepID=A0A6N2LM94_SALVM
MLSFIRDSRSVSYLPSILATATMLHVIKEVEPRNQLEYQNQLMAVLKTSESNQARPKSTPSASTCPHQQAQMVSLTRRSALTAQMIRGLWHHHSHHHQCLNSKEAGPRCFMLHELANTFPANHSKLTHSWLRNEEEVAAPVAMTAMAATVRVAALVAACEEVLVFMVSKFAVPPY